MLERVSVNMHHYNMSPETCLQLNRLLLHMLACQLIGLWVVLHSEKNSFQVESEQNVNNVGVFCTAKNPDSKTVPMTNNKI